MIINKALPEICYTTTLYNKQTAAVKQGEMGYYPIDTKRTAEELNESIGVDQKAVDVMVCGSMFGWDIPAVTSYS